jgi:hypothetical protein
MPDIVSGCTRFYKVQMNDIYDSIAKAFQISRQDFYAWNPAVGTSCKTLWLDAYVCIKGP